MNWWHWILFTGERWLWLFGAHWSLYGWTRKDEGIYMSHGMVLNVMCIPSLLSRGLMSICSRSSSRSAVIILSALEPDAKIGQEISRFYCIKEAISFHCILENANIFFLLVGLNHQQLLNRFPLNVTIPWYPDSYSMDSRPPQIKSGRGLRTLKNFFADWRTGDGGVIIVKVANQRLANKKPTHFTTASPEPAANNASIT